MQLSQLKAGLLVAALAVLAQAAEPDVAALRSTAGKGHFAPFQGNPVLVRGQTGEWDDWALGSMTVVKAGDTFHMYYEGWGQKTIEIGHATSRDGIHWQKDPANPVIARANEGWDSGGTWDPFVLYEDGVFKMWYGATPRGGGKGKFQWGYAESKNGSRFERYGIISHFPNGEVEDDHVVHDHKAGRYYMYYWDRNAEPLGLFRAESTNETDFDFANARPVTINGATNTPMHKFTHVFQDDGVWTMFYSEFIRPRCLNCRVAYATSLDGLSWQSHNTNVLVGQDAEILKVADDLYLMYYGPHGFFDGEGCDIRVAIYEGPLEQLSGTVD